MLRYVAILLRYVAICCDKCEFAPIRANSHYIATFKLRYVAISCDMLRYKPYLSLLWHPPQPSGSPSKVISRPRRPCGALARQGAAVATPAASSGRCVSLNCVSSAHCGAYWCVLVRTGAFLAVFGCYLCISRACIAVLRRF